MKKTFNVAILGAGHIAESMAAAVNGLGDDVCLYAIASRSLEKAQAFAKKWGVKVAYGSYEELASDPDADLIYIATPHSEHFRNAKLCIGNGRNCLVEKAFCANVAQTEKLIQLAKENDVFLAEAMWTRYQPSKDVIKKILESGKLGKLIELEADFSINIRGTERLEKPELCGGALLDLGVYSLTVPAMYFGNDIAKIEANCEKNEYGVDLTDYITLSYTDGRIARLKCSFGLPASNYARISGENGSIVFGPVNCPDYYELFDREGNLIEKKAVPHMINGYEYEILESKAAIEDGKKETASMPLSETKLIMGRMDSIRKQLGVVYPADKSNISDD